MNEFDLDLITTQLIPRAELETWFQVPHPDLENRTPWQAYKEGDRDRVARLLFSIRAVKPDEPQAA